MMAEDWRILRPMVRAVIQEFLEAEMAERLGGKRRTNRRRSGEATITRAA